MATPTVKEIFEDKIPVRLKNNADVVKSVNAVYQFQISGPGGGDWAVDCTAPGGKVITGKASNAQCTVIMTDADFMDMVTGKLDGQIAFMTGKLQIQGDMALAMKLKLVLG